MNIEAKIVPKLSSEIQACIRQALAEDIGPGDVTTNAIASPATNIRGQIIAKQHGIIAGLDVAAGVFFSLDPSLNFNANVSEGSSVERGAVVAELFGSARTLLTAERTALSFLGRLSGIATLTRQFVDAVAATPAKILDTRKTAPGLRAIDKLAVEKGGGHNHRMGLYDMVLLKDNHIDYAGSLPEALRRIRASGLELDIEVEARTLEDVKAAIGLGVQRVLLDNMSIEMMREAVHVAAGRAKLEASGNVTLENVRRIAETGVDYISVGELTHSARVFDVSLKIETHRAANVSEPGQAATKLSVS